MNYTHGAKKDSERFQSYMTQNDTKTYKSTRWHTKVYIIKESVCQKEKREQPPM